MPRLESIAIGGFYELPPQHLAPIASLFAPAQRGKMLDPCAGEGDALQHLASAWNLEPYANELDHDRAAACINKFGSLRALQGDLYTLRTSYGAYQITWINPPYTWNHAENERRRELDMLQHAWKWVQPDGYCLWCVYAHHVSPRAAAWIAQRSQTVDIWALPGKHLGEYRQVIVVCNVGNNAAPTHLMEAILNQVTHPTELTAQTEPRYHLPTPTNTRNFVFAPKHLTPEVALAALQQQSIHQTSAFKTLITPPPPITTTRPAVPPRGGQRILTLAAGFYNGMTLDTQDYGRIAIRSTLNPAEELSSTEYETNAKGDAVTRNTFTLKPTIKITLLTEEGQVIEMNGEAAMGDFITRYKNDLKIYLEHHFQPIYDPQDPQLEPVIIQKLNALRLRKGHNTAYPLLKPQKHVVAAVDRVLRLRADQYGQGSCYLVGQPGVGKTFMAGALISLIHIQRQRIKPGEVILIMCPPHLTKKWKRELLGVDPHCHAAILERTPDVTRFMKRAQQTPHQIHIGIISREMAKLGEGLAVGVQWKVEKSARWPHDQPRPNDFDDTQTRILTNKVPICPVCGSTIMKNDEEVADEAYFYNKNSKTGSAKKRTCVTCDGALWQHTRTFSAPKSGQKFPTKPYRMPLADYINSQYPHRVYLTFFDELHELQNSGADQGRAFMQLAHISRHIVGLTGTIYGGKATSLFTLEWMFNPRVRHHYTWDSAGRDLWVANMGVLQRVEEDRPQYDTETGAFTGHSRFVHRPAEGPGVSPLLVKEILDHSIFIGLKDMGMKNLPPYQDIPVAIAMDEDQYKLYREIQDKLKSYLMQCQREGDATFRGAYLTTLLCQPNAPFRAETVIHRRKLSSINETLTHTVMDIPSLGADRIYPKEQQLIDLITANLAEGRGVGVFVRQTNTRDIQPRLDKLVRTAIDRHHKTFILYSGKVAAKDREEELEKQVNTGVKVFFTNPKCVETGLDLLPFPSLVFYEPSFSLPLTKQASGRAWRLPQKQSCRTYHFFYEGTMEARAVQIIAEKSRAANLLTGDSETGLDALLGDGGDDIIAALSQSWDQDGHIDTTAIATAFDQANPSAYDITQSIWYTPHDIFDTSESDDDPATPSTNPISLPVPTSYVIERFLVETQTWQIISRHVNGTLPINLFSSLTEAGQTAHQLAAQSSHTYRVIGYPDLQPQYRKYRDSKSQIIQEPAQVKLPDYTGYNALEQCSVELGYTLTSNWEPGFTASLSTESKLPAKRKVSNRRKVNLSAAPEALEAPPQPATPPSPSPQREMGLSNDDVCQLSLFNL